MIVLQNRLHFLLQESLRYPNMRLPSCVIHSATHIMMT